MPVFSNIMQMIQIYQISSMHKHKSFANMCDSKTICVAWLYASCAFVRNDVENASPTVAYAMNEASSPSFVLPKPNSSRFYKINKQFHSTHWVAEQRKGVHSKIELVASSIPEYRWKRGHVQHHWLEQFSSLHLQGCNNSVPKNVPGSRWLEFQTAYLR